jgi:hypothetical protein
MSRRNYQLLRGFVIWSISCWSVGFALGDVRKLGIADKKKRLFFVFVEESPQSFTE